MNTRPLIILLVLTVAWFALATFLARPEAPAPLPESAQGVADLRGLWRELDGQGMLAAIAEPGELTLFVHDRDPLAPSGAGDDDCFHEIGPSPLTRHEDGLFTLGGTDAHGRPAVVWIGLTLADGGERLGITWSARDPEARRTTSYRRERGLRLGEIPRCDPVAARTGSTESRVAMHRVDIDEGVTGCASSDRSSRASGASPNATDASAATASDGNTHGRGQTTSRWCSPTSAAIATSSSATRPTTPSVR